MGCCTPNEIGAGAEAASPCKRVNFTLGMLLGVDDFVQESAYHLARTRELARELLGYGTVHGLQVVIEADGDNGPRVRVTTGMAWLPSGTPVCVGTAQCANLNDWLKAHKADLPTPSGSGKQSLYVVLSHADCLTDNVPIPGEPCRDDSELMQPSRVTDSFRMELRLQPPEQREEDAIRDFVAWLLNLPMAPTSPPLSEEEFIDALRAAAHSWLAPDSPPVSPPDYMTGVAPAGTSEELFAAALRLWTTELRPLWMARAGCGCHAEAIASQDDAVLLAALDLDLVASGSLWRVRPEDSSHPHTVVQDESRRPYVLSLRMVQELLARHPGPEPGDTVRSETAFGLAPQAGSSLLFSRADHTHGTPVLPPLGGDLSGALTAARIERLQGVPVAAAGPVPNGHVLTQVGGQWVPTAPSLAGDVQGLAAANQLKVLQGVPLGVPGAVANGQVLTIEGGQWVPRAPVPPAVPPLGGDVQGPVAGNQVRLLQGVPLAAPGPVTNGHVLTVVGGQWVPQAPAPAAVPPLGGDVQGPPAATQLMMLQGRPVLANAPQEGHVLRFLGGQWTSAAPDPVPPPATADLFVARGNKLPFEIVAAAEVEFPLHAPGSAQQPPTLRHQYGGLALRPPSVTEKDRASLQVTLKIPGGDKFRYVVKLTPVWNRETSPFRVFLVDSVKVSTNQVSFAVVLLSDNSFNEAVEVFAFHLELSRYGEEG